MFYNLKARFFLSYLRLGNFINRAVALKRGEALKRNSYEGLSSSVYGGCKKSSKNRKFSIQYFYGVK